MSGLRTKKNQINEEKEGGKTEDKANMKWWVSQGSLVCPQENFCGVKISKDGQSTGDQVRRYMQASSVTVLMYNLCQARPS